MASSLAKCKKLRAGSHRNMRSHRDMLRIRQWFGKRRQVVWAEPELPPFIKVNPMAAGPSDGLQPGDITMAIMAREFLALPDEDEV